MRQIEVPPGNVEIPTFEFVVIATSGEPLVALMEAWIRLPDGSWACRIRIPGHKEGRSRTSVAYTLAYDPAVIRPLTRLDAGGV